MMMAVTRLLHLAFGPAVHGADSASNAVVQGYFKYGDDNGVPAGHESLTCLSSKMPRWVGDAYWDDKVNM